MTGQLRALALLLRLRYVLLWAQIRTGKGRVAVLCGLVLLGALILGAATTGALGAAVMAVRLGQAEMVARAVLSSVFFSGLIFTLMFGVGPSAAFSDAALRQYPVNRVTRFAARHLIGILDPIWILYAGVVFGLAAGFQVAGVCSLALGLPIVAIFLVISYLCAATVLSFITKLLQLKATALVLMLLAAGAYVGLVSIMSRAHHGSVWPMVNPLIGMTPAASAAGALAGASVGMRFWSGVLLLPWAAAAALALRLSERLSFSRHERRHEESETRSFYDVMAELFPARLAPLVAKALRYHLRCNAVRYALISTGPLLMVLAVHRVPASSQITMGLFVLWIAGFASTAMMSVNLFGWDDTGVRRYGLLPLSMGDILRAHSYASLMVGAAGTLPVLALFAAFVKVHVTWKLAVFIACEIAGSLLTFHAVALWLSVLAPKHCDYDSIIGNRLPLVPTQLTLLAIAAPAMLLLRFLKRPDLVLGHWWLMVLVAAAALCAYLLSLRLVAPVVAQRREKLVAQLAG